jgi:glycosyltransferase involved in cell wall biosynthesis
MLDGKRVAVVVPAHNEARLVARTLRGIPKFVDHVVVIDDASCDGTAREVLSVGDARVELLRHEVNRGVGAAIVGGYRCAFERGADVAAVMAGDGQMAPADLERLLAPVLRGDADYAKGDRLSHPDAFAAMPLARFVGNHGLSAMTRLATGLAVQDSQCGYTALSRRAFSSIELDALWPRYGYPNDLLSRLAVARLRVQDVVVRPVYGDERSGIRVKDLFTSFPRVLGLGALRRLRMRRDADPRAVSVEPAPRTSPGEPAAGTSRAVAETRPRRAPDRAAMPAARDAP